MKTSKGEERASHVHSLIRLDAGGLPTHGYRYECRVCGARLRRKSGVMVSSPRKEGTAIGLSRVGLAGNW
jgi:hypothetical protein